MLEYTILAQGKGNWYGCRVEKVNRWYPSSKTCSACGAVVEAIPLHLSEWQCPLCGVVHDRDVNAAINILNQSTVGATGHLYLRCQVQVSHAWGQHVRPGFALLSGQRWTNQEANLL